MYNRLKYDSKQRNHTRKVLLLSVQVAAGCTKILPNVG